VAADAPRFHSDRLGKLVYRDQSLLLHKPFSTLVRERRGTSNLTTLSNLHHPAIPLLRHLSTQGFPVHMSTPPWTTSHNDAAVQRGPHKSSLQHLEFLREELADMVDRATWIVLPYHLVRHFPNLRVSPMGVVPQHERRPRPIVDYTFSGVNQDTICLAPAEAMQFGRTLERLITSVVRADPRYGPVQFFKIDIADGFYRVWLTIHDIPTLAVTIPSMPGEPDLIALPLALPMGWTQSPPAFCAVTETIADLTNQRLHRHRRFPPPHRLEQLSNTSATDDTAVSRASFTIEAPSRNPLLVPLPRPLAAVDVFVDDFLVAAQGSPHALTRTKRTLLHTIDDVFRPLVSTDPPHRTEPISTSKLQKGDGSWSTRKKMLGWTVDSDAMTLTLPPRRLARLKELLDSIPPTRKRLSIDTWHKLLGELRSMSLALPGSRGLFSHLQHALQTRVGTRLRLTEAFHHALNDFRWIHAQLASRPTRLYELVPTAPTLHGTHDASGSGAGGVWLPHSTAVPRHQSLLVVDDDAPTGLRTVQPTTPVPIVWRNTFPTLVQRALVSTDNPTGTINNSQLELLGAFWHDEVAARCFDVRERTIKSSTDNLATLFWYRRGSVTTTSPTATILRQQSMHQRFHRYVSLKDYVPGPLNSLADDASRLAYLDDQQFLTYFNSTYPQPTPWHLCNLPPEMISCGISALRSRMSPTASFLLEPPPPRPNGHSGNPTAKNLVSLRPFKTSPIQSHISKFLHTDIVTESSTQLAALSEAAPWRVPYAPLAKRWRVWGPRTPDSLRKVASIFESIECSQATPAPTAPPSV
jgi:hypothetical protein